MKKTGYIIYIVVCLLACALPSMGMIFYRTDATTENKTLAALPQLEKDGRLNTDFFEECSAYFEDHFAFRRELVTADAEIQSRLFRVSNVDTVIAGTDGWLYYTDTLDDFLGQNGMSERQAFNTAHNIRLLQQYVESQGADFVFTVAPNKNTLYGENMPYYMRHKVSGSRNAERIAPYLTKLGVSYVDLFAPFQSFREVLYLKRDSHWNNKGAVLAYDTILDSLELEHETYETVKAVREKNEYGDLNKMLYPLSARPEWNYEYQYEWDWEYTSEEQNVEAAWISTQSPSGTGSLLMFRDSFGNTLLPLMAQQFHTAFFSKGIPYRIAEYMEQCAPELVIAEKVERNLDEFMVSPPIMPGPEALLENVESAGEQTASVDLREAEESVDYWVVSGIAAERDMEPETGIYVRIEAGGETKVYEAFTTTVEESDYGYRLYLSKEQLQKAGIGDEDRLAVEVIAGKEDAFRIVGQREFTLREVRTEPGVDEK